MLFLVKATSDIDYDEYDAFVVRAETLEEVKNFVKNEPGMERGFSVEELSIEGKSGIILASFNAG